MKLRQTLYGAAIIVFLCFLVFSFVGCKQANSKKETTAITGQDRYRLIILAGQSNMVGAGRKEDIALPPKNENIMYYNLGRTMDLRPASDASFGPELGIMQKITQHFPNEKFLIIKYAIGGSSIYDWSPDRDELKVESMGYPKFGKMCDSLFKYSSEIVAERNVIPTAFIWMQGETDSRFVQAGKEYYEHFSKLIQRVRKEYRSDTLPVIYGKVNPEPKRYVGLAEVQKSQDSTYRTIPHTYMVNTDGLEKRQDSLHYSSQGQWELGKKFGNVLVDLLKK